MDSIGFKLNVYDLCVAKNNIHNKKKKITWHVDDLKMSHADNDIFDNFIQLTSETYEDITKLNPLR